MDIKKAFKILKIEITKDEAAIADAYRTELPYNNPEDNEEGFKSLREAYEFAINYAREDESEKELSEFDIWINKADEIYADIDQRKDVDAWRELFSDDICTELDTVDELRERFLVYIMSHHLMPRGVWQLIDEHFGIKQDVDILSEKFPEDFLNYITYYMDNDGYLKFDNLEYLGIESDGSEIDGYINGLMGLHREIAVTPSLEQLEKVVELSKYETYHPYEDAFRIMIYKDALDKLMFYSDDEEIMADIPFEKDNYEEEAEKIKNKLSELVDKYMEYDNLEIFERVEIANSLWYLDKKDAARERWEQILDEVPDNTNARLGVARDYLFLEKYEEAADEMDTVLQGRDDKPEIARLMKKINSKLIELHKKQLEEGIANERHPGAKLAIDLAWKLWQNEDPKGARELIEKTVPDSESEYEYVNIYGRLLYSEHEYEKALPQLLRWCEILENLDGLSEKDIKRRLERRPMAHTCVSVCYFEAKDREKSEEHIIRAIKDETEREGHTFESLFEYRIQYAKMLIAWKDYAKCIDICDEIIKEDPNVYAAYLIHQEACYEIGRAQMVIDDYGTAIGIVPNYYRPYLYAAMVFYDYDQYDNGLEVLNRAREAGVEFNRKMKLYEERLIWSKLNSGDDASKAHEIIDDLLENYEEEEVDGVKLAEILSDKSFAYMIEKDFDKAIEFVDKAIEAEPDNPKYYLIKGDWLSEDNNASKDLAAAAECYEQAKAHGMIRSAWLYFSLGYCYENLKKYDKASEAYESAIEINEQYKTVYQRLINMNLKLYDNAYKMEYATKAEEYADRLLDVLPEDPGSYWYLGKSCEEGVNFDKAMKIFQRAAEKYPDDCNMLYKAGSCFRRCREYDKAKEYLIKCVELQKKEGRKEIGALRELGQLFEMQGEYEKALEYYKIECENAGYKDPCYEHIGDMYLYLKRYEEAIAEYNKIKEYQNVNLIARVYVLMGDIKKAVKIYKAAAEKVEGDDVRFYHRNFGDFYQESEKNYKKAIGQFDLAIRASLEYDEKFSYAVNKIKSALLLNDKKLARIFANEALSYFEMMNISVEEYFSNALYAPIFIGRMGWVKAGLGEYEKALEYFDRMNKTTLCRTCNHNGCYEAVLFAGIVLKVMGEEEKANEKLNASLDRNPYDEFTLGLLNML